ncbi:MAG: ABC transporter permease subunit, partial [Acidimicrobiia bacterium]|nr:ABC transporter permease subunit [Acidimicrobiia bacterium]
GHHVTNSLSLALTAGLVCPGTGVVLAPVVARRGRLARAGSRLATIGYAMPGPVVAVGVVVTLAAIDRGRWLPGDIILVGSVIGLVFALVVRFMAIAFQGAESGLDKVPPASVDSARLLGAGPLRVALAVEIPAVRFGLLAAAALLFVDMIKELPITLLLRPFGVDTLSVWVWQATSESLWTQAALPSLVMVAVGMVAVGALLVALDRGAEVVS